MAEHLSTEIITLYRRGELRGKQRFDADIHLAACQRCSELAGQKEKLQFVHDAIRSSLKESADLPVEHLSGEQIADYVNRKLDPVDLEIVTSHLAWCSLCEEDANDIKAFAAEIAGKNKKNLSFISELRDRVWGVIGNLFQSRNLHLAGAVTALAVAAISFGMWRLADSRNMNSGTVPVDVTANQAKTITSPTPPNIFSSQSSADAVSEKPVKQRPEQDTDLAWALPNDRQLLFSALRNQKLEVNPEIARIRSQVKLMSESSEESFSLLAPTGSAIRDDLPVLKWQPRKDSVKYKVLLVDKTDGKTLPVSFTEGTESRIDSQLQRGHRYVWHIVAIPKVGNESYGRWMNRTFGEFIVLTEEQLRQVEEAEKHYRSSKEPLAQIALAASYAKVGLVDDAERELQSYLKEKPNSPQVRKMLELLRVGGN